ncbi:hypothetical protein [Nocardia huaxiensis]|uniref:Transposase DDE domain-containing protein n=1 Tax=Nocardia huaxiensis TaxID=2755382 RepID=A0A7D6VC78_9NOCA|nr:hypothetical protein [Nocardia huaxiensis]QLY31573.1 hypothetical protein H0264_04335 [Nocardia huaxiensis]UFS95125.1 hypothetical protein LPY97_31170 [Nocardia huaxiensis]
MTLSPSPETVAMGSYAVLLIAIAFVLDVIARHIHRRADRHRTAGFRYLPDHDYWVCPTDQPLWPHSIDKRERLVRYRGRPTVCNACPEKRECTPSLEGREITRAVDPWPHSEAGRFHRGIALLLMLLAAVFLLLAAALKPSIANFAVLVPISLGWLAAGWVLTDHFRHTPAAFPAGLERSSR